jgi:hypothetical protein
VSGLLFNAFKALGPGATKREVTLVANALRDTGDAEVRELLWPPDPEGWDRLDAIADEAGANRFVVLDLATAFQNPGAFIEFLEHEHQSTGAVD